MEIRGRVSCYDGPGQVFRTQNMLQLRLAQQVALDGDLCDTLAALQRLFRDLSGTDIANVGIQRGGNTYGFTHLA